MLVIFLRFDLQQWQLRVRCISSVTRTLTRLSPVFGGPARKPPKTKTWLQETSEKIGCPYSAIMHSGHSGASVRLPLLLSKRWKVRASNVSRLRTHEKW